LELQAGVRQGASQCAEGVHGPGEALIPISVMAAALWHSSVPNQTRNFTFLPSGYAQQSNHLTSTQRCGIKLPAISQTS